MTAKGTILVVDDTPANLKLLVDTLTAEGYQALPVESGELALAAVAAQPPELILLDIHMPGLDGFEVYRRLQTRAESRDVKIVALSASVFREEREQVLAAGADDFVPKPIQFNLIYDCLTKHLGVRFVSDAPPASSAMEPSASLDREALAALPSSLRTELADALVSLDAARIAGLILRVTELNPLLGGVLEHHAGLFQYTIVLQALQSCRRSESKETAIL